MQDVGIGFYLGEARYAGRRKLEVGVVGIRALLPGISLFEISLIL